MKLKALLGGIVSESAYFKAVVEAKRRIFTYKKPVSKVQAQSTQAALDRDPSKDEEHFNRPEAEANYYTPSGEPDINERSFNGRLDLASVQSALDLRLKGHYNVLGQSPLSGVPPTMKAKAVEAFMSKRGVFLTDDQKALIHKYYEVTKFPDAVLTKEDLEIISKFHQLVDVEAMVAGESDGK